MTEKNGKSKGVGFVSFVSAASAKIAIEEMNGYELRGKRLKVELNKKDENALGGNQKLDKFDFSYNWLSFIVFDIIFRILNDRSDRGHWWGLKAMEGDCADTNRGDAFHQLTN